MNPQGAIILIAVLCLTFFGNRRLALLTLAAGSLILPQGEQITVGGINLFATRIIEVGGFVRVLAKGELRDIRPNPTDRWLVALYGFSTLVYVIRSHSGQAYQIGLAADAILTYFTFRSLIKGVDDLDTFLRGFALVLIPYVGILLIERVTTYNLFTYLSEGNYDVGHWLRDGKLRCQGSFRHPSLLGTIGASYLSLYIALAFDAVSRRRAILGVILCLAIVIASNSGGPASCTGVVICGWGIWRIRQYMKQLRLVLIAGIIGLAVTMKAPIWYILAKVSSVTGGDGYHRAHLLDMAFQNLSHWWLAGMPITATASWFPYVIAATGGADMTNQFLAFGISAGIGALVLFLLLLMSGFRSISKALRAASNDTQSDRYEVPLWGLGVMLTCHIFNWLGITYWDQTYVFWFMQFAALGSITAEVLASTPLGAHADASANERQVSEPIEIDRNFEAHQNVSH